MCPPVDHVIATVLGNVRTADLVCGANVLAQVPDLQRLRRRHRDRCWPRRAPSRSSSRTCVRLVEGNQFDTIYHEHFSYFSLLAVERVLRSPRPDRLRRRGAAHPRRLAADLARHAADATDRSVDRCPRPAPGREERPDCSTLDYYRTFGAPGRGDEARGCSSFLIDAKRAGKIDRRATARPARATRCSTTAGSGPTSSTTRSTATRTSRAGSCRDAHPDPPTRSGSPRRGPTTS